jgi:hypothetical protein
MQRRENLKANDLVSDLNPQKKSMKRENKGGYIIQLRLDKGYVFYTCPVKEIKCLSVT